ncbi:MAG: MFS transporter [Termitinemataceae bacterium]|nr:MAG: MFS transporter [Termitinemataceae bacterium]
MKFNWKKNAALFLTGQALSFFGTMVVQYAILWHITLKSQSGSMMTVFTIAGLLPMFFISPFAGVWADRFNRKYIINIADGATAFFSLAAAVFIILGINSYSILLICAFVRSIGQGVQTPAVGAFIPQIIPEKHLTKVNGFQGSIQSFVTLTSPMLSGALMSFAPLEIIFFLDVITALIGISIVFFFVKIPEKEFLNGAQEPNGALEPALAHKLSTQEPALAQKLPAQEPALALEKTNNTAYFYDLKEGVKYIRKHKFILRMIVVSAFFLFLIAPAAFLTPLQVTRNFGQEVWRLSAIEISFYAGMMAGGVLIGIWGGFKNRIHTMAFSCLMCGVLTAGLGLVPSFWLYLVIMLLEGISLPLYNAPSMVLLQTVVEPAFMGRVISVFTMVSSTVMPMGMVLFGPAADIVSIDLILVVTGLLSALTAIPMLASRTLLRAGAGAI